VVADVLQYVPLAMDRRRLNLGSAISVKLYRWAISVMASQNPVNAV
jgi:tRNA C32,U32 (ribose-2'-O)-methylase TrmJ